MINKIKGLQIVDLICGRGGTFLAVVRVPAGFMTAYEIGSEVPSLGNWKRGALQAIQFKAEGTSHWLTVFARKGTTVMIMDREIAQDLRVATVNQLYYNTNLMDSDQYKAVGAVTWADRVFVQNEVVA